VTPRVAHLSFLVHGLFWLAAGLTLGLAVPACNAAHGPNGAPQYVETLAGHTSTGATVYVLRELATHKPEVTAAVLARCEAAQLPGDVTVHVWQGGAFPGGEVPSTWQRSTGAGWLYGKMYPRERRYLAGHCWVSLVKQEGWETSKLLPALEHEVAHWEHPDWTEEQCEGGSP